MKVCGLIKVYGVEFIKLHNEINPSNLKWLFGDSKNVKFLMYKYEFFIIGET